MTTRRINGHARQWSLAASALGVGAAMLLAACSSSGGSADATTGATRPSSAAAASAAAACSAELASDWVNIPGIDPDGPTPSPAELTAWATPQLAQLTTVRAGVPAGLTTQVDVLTAAVKGAAAGKPVNTDDPALNTALTKVNAWAHDSCGYAQLDVTDNGGGLAGVPATLAAGPLALKFTNTGTDPAKAGFVLLVGKLRAGQTVTAADVAAGRADLGAVADIVAVAQPTGTDSAYSLATLSAGHYIVASPTGPPPAFTGTLAADLTVS